MNLADFVLIAASPLTCIFCGILKEYLRIDIPRPILRFGAPSAASMCIIFVLEGTLSSLVDPTSIWYIIMLVILLAVLWVLSYRLVDLGQHIVHREDSDAHHHTDYAIQKTRQVITPMLDSFAANTKSNISADLRGELSQVNTQLAVLAKNDELHATQTGSLKESYENLIYNYDNTVQDLEDTITKSNNLHNDISDIILELRDIVSRQDELICILSARMEALLSSEKPDENSQGEQNAGQNNITEGDSDQATPESQKTILTTQDGVSSRAIGNKMQGIMAQILRAYGFDVEEGYGAGKPDYIIRKSGKMVAIGSNKSYTLREQPGRMQRSISIKDIAPELILAKKLNAQLVIFVTNIANSRKWAKKITIDMLESWNGEPTPIIMAKNDPESGKALEESFLSVLADLGADV